MSNFLEFSAPNFYVQNVDKLGLLEKEIPGLPIEVADFYASVDAIPRKFLLLLSDKKTGVSKEQLTEMANQLNNLAIAGNALVENLKAISRGAGSPTITSSKPGAPAIQGV